MHKKSPKLNPRAVGVALALGLSAVAGVASAQVVAVPAARR